MDDQLEMRFRFLRAAGTAGMPHTQHGLLDHLLGTRQLLHDWGARPEVCDAGLFHSVYGTEHYEPAAIALSTRAEVRQLIGDDAEFLTWVFCVMSRPTFDQNLHRQEGFSVQHRLTGEQIELTATQFEDLVTLTFANTLEALARLSWSVRRACRSYLRPFRAVAVENARIAFDRVDARAWQFWK